MSLEQTILAEIHGHIGAALKQMDASSDPILRDHIVSGFTLLDTLRTHQIEVRRAEVIDPVRRPA